MTIEEAIKYLKQLYPNGGHCWLDEQRIEAIGMAIAALEHEKPVSEDLEEAAQEYTEKGSKCQEELDAFKAGANWQKQQMMAKAICGRVRVNAKSNYHALMYGCWDINDALKNCNDGDKVKVIIVRED